MADKLNDVEVIIKLGGSAITRKNQLETENLAALDNVVKIVSDLRGKCIIVHGAGSFGHFQAHEYGTARGFGSDLEQGRIGFAKVRVSVTKLNHKVTEFFVNEGLPAVGISPCGCWLTSEGHVTTVYITQLKDLLAAGFVPVLHGDCVIDTKQGCAILSGDKIIERLVLEFQPKRVVFLTDVDGIYDKPPEQEDAILIPQINVSKNGNISIPIATNRLSHDVTGGVKGKLNTAANIVTGSQNNTKVFITSIASECGYKACVDGVVLPGEGTVVFLEIAI